MQEAKKEAGAAAPGEGEGASAQPPAPQRAGAGGAEDDEAYFDEAPPPAPQNGAAGGPLSEASVVEAMRGNGPLGNGGGGASSSNGNGAAPHGGGLNDSLEAYMTNLSAGAQLQQPSAARQHGQSVPLAVPQLGSCASSGRAWRLWTAWHSDSEASSLGAQPLPRVH